MGEKELVLAYPFANVYGELPKMGSCDGLSGGGSPITFRWLTKKNRYVNIGLEEVTGQSCEIKANNNSFAVSQGELLEIFTSLKTHMDGLGKPLPVLTRTEAPTKSETEVARRSKVEAKAEAAQGV